MSEEIKDAEFKTAEVTIKTDTPLAQMNDASTLQVFSNTQSLELAWKISNNMAKSSIVPKDYQNQPSNCLIALDVAARLNMSPITVMQNLYIVYGRPSWSGQMVTALINGSRRYSTPLKFELSGKGDKLQCFAYATGWDGLQVNGPTITMDMVKAEGWLSKSGSKWLTMPEIMMQYRAASFFGRINCPDVIMGLYTSEEAYEIGGADKQKPEVFDALGEVQR